MLIQSPRHTARDMAAWENAERADAVVARSVDLARHELRALAVAHAFAAGGCYAGTSWGKDSTVLAHLVARLASDGVRVPLVCLVSPADNPDCARVRDAFLAAHPVEYHEIQCPGRWDRVGWHATGTMEAGFAEAVRRFGPRHISGVRAEESGPRRERMRRWGHTTTNTCAPLGWWRGRHVFGYLHKYGLPVHPAYAMSRGGLLERERLRVAWVGLLHGTGRGRRDWERTYYPEMLRYLERAEREETP